MRSDTNPAKAPQGIRFSPPKGPQTVVERVRLLSRIEESGASLTLICAPAGFGKTTLMQQLRQRYEARGVATVWLRVDHGDNDLGRFLQSLIGALHAAGPHFLPPGGAGSRSGGALSAQGFAADLLDRISLSDTALALFLDDLELIADQDVLGFLQRLLENLGPNHRVVIGSRTSPPLALGRMRAHQLLLELEHNDLRFSQEETSRYLERQSMGSHGIPQALQLKTEGWPAALQLATITMAAKGKSGADWLQRFSGSTEGVAEYLAQEVLDTRPVPERDFLLRSSVLGEFCAELCDAALGRKDSGQMIAQTLRGNLLLSPIDRDQRWYRYHPLFADFLRARLRRDAAEEIPGLHRRAATWARDQGLMSQAVVHALAAQDQSLAADLLASSAMDMVRSGRVADTARAIATLPEAEVTRRPLLLRAAAFAAIFAHRYGAATRFIEAIERSGDSTINASDDEIVTMRLMLLGWTDRIAELFETVVAIAPQASRFTPFTAGLAANASAYCNISRGRYVEAERDLARARQACEPIQALYVLSYSTCFSAVIELILGNTASARITLDGAMNRTIAEDQRYGSSGAVVATHLADVLYEANELDACEALVNDYLPIVAETGLPDHLIMLHRIAARLHLRQGRFDAGQAILVELGEIGARRGISRLTAAAWLERSYAAMRCDNLDDARHCLALGSDPATWQTFGPFFHHASDIEDPLIARLRLQLMLGQGEKALPELLEALRNAEESGRRRRTLRLHFLQAQLLESMGRQREASPVFESVMRRATACGLVRTVADENWATGSLIKRMSVSGDPRTAALLRELAPSSSASAPETKRVPAGESPGAKFHVTNRELQVLRLLSKGHSNKAIARELFLSENTIETHLRRIYEKLGTRNRTQAAALAREAGAV
ncbi:MAG TPA: LuxR C-terminal-related transcriptional regulator [Burkholderiaceae bacterium]|nr:LuxR C-terminal-related transcriptional regulator [Burkholderiaceae bacterium]